MGTSGGRVNHCVSSFLFFVFAFHLCTFFFTSFIYSFISISQVGFIEGDNNKTQGIKNIFASRINGMLGLATAFKRLDTSEGSYSQELYEASEVLIQVRYTTHIIITIICDYLMIILYGHFI